MQNLEEAKTVKTDFIENLLIYVSMAALCAKVK